MLELQVPDVLVNTYAAPVLDETPIAPTRAVAPAPAPDTDTEKPNKLPAAPPVPRGVLELQVPDILVNTYAAPVLPETPGAPTTAVASSPEP